MLLSFEKIINLSSEQFCWLLKFFCTVGTFGCLYKGSVRGLFDEQPRKKIDVSIKALRGMQV